MEKVLRGTDPLSFGRAIKPDVLYSFVVRNRADNIEYNVKKCIMIEKVEVGAQSILVDGYFVVEIRSEYSYANLRCTLSLI